MKVARLKSPVSGGDRISSLDAIRGVAVLGILPMNVVSFALVGSAYMNISAPGTDTFLDWTVAVVGEVFVDQKFMALFSMLFGAGIVLFADRAKAKTSHPVWLSLWRNFLLLLIGLLHGLLWEGDILVIYALLSPLLLLLRKLPSSLLLFLGIGIYALSPLAAIAGQMLATEPADLAGFWFEAAQSGELAEVVLITDAFLRALGAMLVGIALFRWGVLQGQRDRLFYRRLTIGGLVSGIPLAVAGVVWVSLADYSADVAFIGSIPNTIATLPMATAYLAIIILWNSSGESRFRNRIRAVGRMALTNYLSQSVVGVLTFSVVLAQVPVTRSAAIVFVLLVWGAQLWWSLPWLNRFRYGPMEWAWRCATYRSWQPIRRSNESAANLAAERRP